MTEFKEQEKTNTYPKVLGLISCKGIFLDPKLSQQERLDTVNRLSEVKSQGYNSCVVTQSGTYATKRINP